MMPILKGGFTVCSKCSATRSSLSTNTSIYREVRNAVCGSDIQWRGRSYAASLPSERPKSQNVRRRVSKDERRTMVESFVNKYRRANEGKFPTSSATHKQVGGSYYVVRNILQELESQSKASPSNIENEYSMGKELIQENESLPKAGTRNNGHSEAIDNVETISTRDEHLYADGELQTVTWAEKTLSEGVAKCPIAGHSDIVQPETNLLKRDHIENSHPVYRKLEDVNDPCSDLSDTVAAYHPNKKGIEPKGEAEEVCYSYSATTNHQKKEQAVLKCLLQSDGRNQKVERPPESLKLGSSPPRNFMIKQTVLNDKEDSNSVENEAEKCQRSSDSERYTSEISKRQNDEAEFSKKSTIWSSLKSFADGLVGFWRRL